MSEKKTGLIEKIKSKKSFEYVLVGLLGIIVLLLFFSGKITTAVTTATTDGDYVSKLETRLEKVLSKVEDAGSVSVVITVKSGMTSVLASERQTSTQNGKSETVETPILVSGKPVILTEMYPEIVGVVIVADGGNNIAVKIALVNAATTLLDVSAEKVKVLSK